MPKLQKLAKLLLVAGVATAALAMPQAASASSYQVLEKFAGAQGKFPSGNLIADGAGNLYGMTSDGGSRNCGHGCGVAYRIAADGTYSIVYAFQGHSDGYRPYGNLLPDARGNLYGTTSNGGAFKFGTAFKLAPDGTETILHSFGSSTVDGIYPQAGLIDDGAGNLYGTTFGGGAAAGDGGTVFKIAQDGTETVLYSFCSATNCSDGQAPLARLLLDGAGNLYGTTWLGGNIDAGTVFKLAKDGTYTVLHSFEGLQDGGGPLAGLIADSTGNLYGTTQSTVYEITLNGTYAILREFDSGDDLVSELLLDQQGYLVGTTYQSDDIFRLATDGTGFTVLHNFGNPRKGHYPNTAVIQVNGHLYGATRYGGRSCHSSGGCGVVYEFTP